MVLFINMAKTIVSFDIGIKNLAYCIFTVGADSLIIRDWNVINLLDAGGKHHLYPYAIVKKPNPVFAGKSDLLIWRKLFLQCPFQEFWEVIAVKGVFNARYKKVESG